MKKRTSRLLSVLLTLVMVLGLLPALGTTALADERFDLYLEVGENAFDKPEIQSIIYRLTGQHAKGLGPYYQRHQHHLQSQCRLQPRPDRDIPVPLPGQVTCANAAYGSDTGN